MPHYVFRLFAAALLLVPGGCASTNLFSGLSARNKAASDHSVREAEQEQSARTDRAAHDRAPQSNWTAQDRVPERRAIAKPFPDADRGPVDLLAESERRRRAGDLIGARLACEQAIRSKPSDLEAKYQLARISDDQGRFADAERIYLGLLHEKPGDPVVQTSLGWSYYLQRRYDDSERCLREALAQDPQSQVAWNNLGFVYGARGDLDSAWKCFRTVGTEAQAQDAMAMLTQNLGTVPASGERAISASDRDPRSENLSRRQGDVTLVDAGAKATSPSAQLATPQASKLADDLQRLRAESDRQQEQLRSRQDSQKISAPSPWNDDRQGASGMPQRDTGDFPPAGASARTVPYGYGAPSANPQRTRPSPGDNATAEYRIPEWPGGQSTGSQPAGVPSAGTPPSGSAAPARVQWQDPRAAEPSRVAPSGNVEPARNSSQDSEAAAAQVGLSAGPGNMGIPVSDLPPLIGGQTPNGGAAQQNPNRQPGTAPAVIRLQPSASGFVPAQRLPPDQ
jgi:Flp pilus assembly protein TadD